MKKALIILIVALSVVGSIARPSTADYQLDVKVDPLSMIVMTLHHDFTEGKNLVPSGSMGHVGLYGFTYTGMPEEVTLASYGFCIEVQRASSSSRTYSVVDLQYAPYPLGPGGDPMFDQKARYMQTLWNQHFDHETMSTNNIQAAAFQIAVWGIVYDGQLTTSGGGTAGDAARVKAAEWLSGLQPASSVTSLLALSSSNHQDFLVLGSIDSQLARIIPLPGSLVLFGIGLGCIGVTKRVRRK